MNKKFWDDVFEDSQLAIKGYINHRSENRSRHKARVLISPVGKTCFNDIVYVYASIEDANNPFVIIEGNVQFQRHYYDKYTIENHRFGLIRGTLLILAKDIWGNDIEIEITGI